MKVVQLGFESWTVWLQNLPTIFLFYLPRPPHRVLSYIVSLLNVSAGVLASQLLVSTNINHLPRAHLLGKSK